MITVGWHTNLVNPKDRGLVVDECYALPETRSLGLLADDVLSWAADRGLLDGDPRVQTLKLVEEVGELARAQLRGDINEAMDAIGDCTVVLTILSHMLGTTLRNCLQGAVDTITPRTGIMVNGVFIKDE